VTHADTRRDKKETARRAAFPQARGPLSLLDRLLAGMREDGIEFLAPPPAQ
jgi:hypothetical protein